MNKLVLTVFVISAIFVALNEASPPLWHYGKRDVEKRSPSKYHFSALQ